MKIEIEAIEVAERVRKEIAKIDELAADIDANGLINPVTVMVKNGNNADKNGSVRGERYQLLAGLRRLRAAQALGWRDILVNVVAPSDAEQALRMEIAENEQREPFSTSEKVNFGILLEEIERAKAKERMSIGGKGGLDEAEGVPNSAHLPKGRTRDIVAKKVGMGKMAYDQAKYIAKNAPSEVMDEIDEGKRSITAVYGELKAKEKAAKVEGKSPIPTEIGGAVDVADSEVDDTAAADFAAQNEIEDFGDGAKCAPELAASSPSPEMASEPLAEVPKKLTAAQIRAEKEMAALSPKDRAAIEKRRAFDAMTDKEKIADLEARLNDERFRADKAESELAREKELRFNATYHRDGTIDNQRGQIERLIADNERLEADLEAAQSALEAANARIAELEKMAA